MVTKTDQFITQMKLRELREQRTRLLKTYDALSQRVAQEENDARRLQVLYTGLRQIAFATHTLHPDVANLEPLLLELETGAASSQTLAFWRTRLENELRSGRLRSEIVYLFGALLDQWAVQPKSEMPSDGASAAARAQLIAQATTTLADKRPSFTILDNLLDAFSLSPDEAAAHLQKALGEKLRSRVDPTELTPVLDQISANPYCPPAVRAQARRFQGDDLLQKELADALTIMLERINEWNWPEEGLQVYAAQTPSKWRLFTEEDLPTACFLDLLGGRWHAALQQVLREEQQVRLKRLRRQASTGETVFASAFHQTAGLSLLGEYDLWAEAPREAGTPLGDELNRWATYDAGEYWSILKQRAQMRGKLHDVSEMTGYGLRETITGMENALLLLNAEVQLARAAFPAQPWFLLKVDLQDFYPALPHDLLLRILKRYGLSPTQLAFFRTYLRLPIQDGNQVLRTQRGVPNLHALSDTLGDLVLGLLEWHIQRVARVQIIRLVDDIAILTPSAEEAEKAWQAVQEFCADGGLRLNLDKCGSVCVHGERPATLPAGPFTWLMLLLDEQGDWRVHQEAFEAYRRQAQEQVSQAGSLLAQVEAYNRHLKYLIQALGLRAPLGESHRRSVNQAMLRFHQELFGEGQGMLTRLRQGLQAHFLENASAEHLPEAWFYWPLTAGGCGLIQAVILTTAYAEQVAHRPHVAPPEERPRDWQRRNNGWVTFYHQWLSAVTPKEPVPNQVMETLVNDFIARGAELSSGKQQKLAPYWRWVLYIYGPHIREALGTFRFLISELVPLQLTTRTRGQTEATESIGEEDDIPF